MGGPEIFRAYHFRIMRVFVEGRSHFEHIDPHLRVFDYIAVPVCDAYGVNEISRAFATPGHIE